MAVLVSSALCPARGTEGINLERLFVCSMIDFGNSYRSPAQHRRETGTTNVVVSTDVTAKVGKAAAAECPIQRRRVRPEIMLLLIV